MLKQLVIFLRLGKQNKQSDSLSPLTT